ncbi:unnamed protein product [Heligmosomoides polygyrus]|uniref:HA2 domain-containing protein n=1 Tax=Heligmosomoides polygyrus TaxID=6339 RepID=A0A183GDP9_HELPZ|nr:unnamed protein product [Heligmosomoides polygyrus]
MAVLIIDAEKLLNILGLPMAKLCKLVQIPITIARLELLVDISVMASSSLSTVRSQRHIESGRRGKARSQYRQQWATGSAAHIEPSLKQKELEKVESILDVLKVECLPVEVYRMGKLEGG